MFVTATLSALITVLLSYFIWKFCSELYYSGKELMKLPDRMKTFKYILYGNTHDFLDIANMIGEHCSSPLRLPMSSVFVVYEPNQVKTVLQSQHCLERGFFYKVFDLLLGEGLATAPVSFWTESRKTISPFYNSNMLRKFFGSFVKQSLILANKLEEIGENGNEIIFNEHVRMCIYANTYDVIVGNKVETVLKDQHFEALMRLTETVNYRINLPLALNILMFNSVIYNFTPLRRKQQNLSKTVHLLTNKLIEQHQNELKQHSMEMENTNHESVLDILIESSHKKNWTQKIIFDNLVSLILASSDSIGTTLNFTVFMLANFPEIQTKVYEELLEIYGMKTPTSAPVKHDDLQHMHYLERIIKETMRLFPVFPVVGRDTTKDIKIGDTVLPKKATIVMPIITMFRNKKYWPNPLKFDPDRFLTERIKACDSYYFIPFSDGPRNCIVILATLIRTFVFKVDQSIEIDKIKLTTDMGGLIPFEPLKVKIEKRKFSDDISGDSSDSQTCKSK
ncbi:cytochrome P450 4c21 isoform X2 [Monomorium pharaonis]|uniref:cytochrome P450 4c21 isoform X2 n=1 Tax=Monomorium pharaonis TaxID=307658 RepID=UPI001746FC22|nr:cytochrome P450 4c21 isoform X2 [Monomorium pharaonis]